MLLMAWVTRIKQQISVTAESERRNVPVTQKALPRWIATERRRRRNNVERGSWVSVASRRPISMTRWKVWCSPQVPDVSIAKRIKWTPVVMSAYFCNFIASAVAAAEPARVQLARTWDPANVSGQVASHARQRPRDQGWTRVTPSGRFPLPVHSEYGSRVASVPDLMNARQSTSLIWLWCEWRPDPKREDRPWWPSTVTVLSQTHTWELRADNWRSESRTSVDANSSVVHLVSDTRQSPRMQTRANAQPTDVHGGRGQRQTRQCRAACRPVGL